MHTFAKFGFGIPTILATALSFSTFQAFGADESPIATIGKQRISALELDARVSGKLSEMQKSVDSSLRQLNLGYARERYSVTEKELNALLDERVLALEATAKKTTPNALKTAVKVPTVTEAQIKGFYDSNSAQMQEPYEQMTPLIKDYLQKQANENAQRDYLTTLRRKYKVSVQLEPLRETVAAVGPQRGSDDAAVTIVEFSDFQCPFCGRFSPVVKEVLEKYPKQVRLIYRHLPLTKLHPNAQKAAEAAVCAQDQGKFWEMHDLMFAEQNTLGEDALKEKAKRLGLDSKSFDECLGGGKAGDVVQRDASAADQLGIGGTPFSFINGRFVNGASSAQDLSEIIEDELRRVGAPSAEPRTAGPAVRR